jgi:hypothetical protein
MLAQKTWSETPDMFIFEKLLRMETAQLVSTNFDQVYYLCFISKYMVDL